MVKLEQHDSLSELLPSHDTWFIAVLIFCGVLILFSFLKGCDVTVHSGPNATLESVKDDLPKGAYDVTDLENKWFSFKLKVDDEERKFMVRGPFLDNMVRID